MNKTKQETKKQLEFTDRELLILKDLKLRVESDKKGDDIGYDSDMRSYISIEDQLSLLTKLIQGNN